MTTRDYSLCRSDKATDSLDPSDTKVEDGRSMPDGIVTCNVGAQSGDVGPFRPSPAADDQTKYESQQEDH